VPTSSPEDSLGRNSKSRIVLKAGTAFETNNFQDAKSVALLPSMVMAVMLKEVSIGLSNSAQKSEKPTAVPANVAPAVAAPYLM